MGKKILVTGGSRGIGKAIVETLTKEGNEVVFSYATNREAADEVVTRVTNEGGKAWTIQADTSDYDSAGRLVNRAKELMGEVDAVVNNAGITRDKSLFIMAREEWDSVINTNLNGYFNVTRQIIGYFMKYKRGRIVNITSVSGSMGTAGQTNYCASKAGIIGFTRSLAKEVGKLNIPVNCVAPGFIATDMTAGIHKDHLEVIRKQIPMQRLGNPKDVADLVSFLISDKARYITGQTFTIDGGLTA